MQKWKEILNRQESYRLPSAHGMGGPWRNDKNDMKQTHWLCSQAYSHNIGRRTADDAQPLASRLVDAWTRQCAGYSSATNKQTCFNENKHRPQQAGREPQPPPGACNAGRPQRVKWCQSSHEYDLMIHQMPLYSGMGSFLYPWQFQLQKF